MTDMASLSRDALAFIRRHELLRPGDRVAAAVSGGADSIALLRGMLELRGELGIVLSVAHFNHKIRGEAADADEQFVRELAAAHDLELHVSSADAPAHATANKLSLETAARELRYSFFRELIGSGAVSKVMTAHTQDDQAETVLMRIMRGTGTSGLAGIYPTIEVSGGSIIRPLLSSRRCEIEDYLRALSQPWREDATNADTHHTRNRVRHVLLPLLETEFSNNVRQRLAELAEIARAEEMDWEQMLSQSNLLVDHNKHLLDGTKLSRLSLALQRRVIRQLGDELNLRLDFETIDAIQRLTTNETSNVVLPDGWRVTRRIIRRPSGGKNRVVLVFERTERLINAPSPSGKGAAAPDSQRDYELTFRWPGEVALPGETACLRARLIDLSTGNDESELGYNQSHLLDADKLLPELTLRNWRPGDQFWPAHTAGPKKVKELLQKQHVTGSERTSWPVLLSGNDIVWMRGFRISEKHRVTLSTKRAVLIDEEPVTVVSNERQHR